MRVIGVSMADIAVMSICHTCTSAAAAISTTTAWMNLSPIAR